MSGRAWMKEATWLTSDLHKSHAAKEILNGILYPAHPSKEARDNTWSISRNYKNKVTARPMVWRTSSWPWEDVKFTKGYGKNIARPLGQPPKRRVLTEHIAQGRKTAVRSVWFIDQQPGTDSPRRSWWNMTTQKYGFFNHCYPRPRLTIVIKWNTKYIPSSLTPRSSVRFCSTGPGPIVQFSQKYICRTKLKCPKCSYVSSTRKMLPRNRAKPI